jgi:hypothetical protein
MADDVDRAEVHEQAFREYARQKQKPVPLATGFCLWCNIEVNRDRCFCDLDCRDDWELAQAARERNGR